MAWSDLIGYLASALVLAAFCMRGMVALRMTAIAGNLAFIVYGALAGIDPVLVLHVVLLPLNALRLAQARLPCASRVAVVRASAHPSSTGSPSA